MESICFSMAKELDQVRCGLRLQAGSEVVQRHFQEGWSAGRTSSMVQARFSKAAGEAKAQITVTEMPADANEWVSNVKRWAGQVGLDELTDQQLTERTSEIKVDDVDGKLVDLVADSDSEQGVIAAMVKREGSAWFFKLSGEKELVDQSREEFETFMDSIRYQ